MSMRSRFGCGPFELHVPLTKQAYQPEQPSPHQDRHESANAASAHAEMNDEFQFHSKTCLSLACECPKKIAHLERSSLSDLAELGSVSCGY